MKKILVYTLATIGFISICGFAFLIVGEMIFPRFSYLNHAYDEFISREKLVELEKLYEKVEKEGLSEIQPVKTFGSANYPVTKKMPSNWVPQAFRKSLHNWGQHDHSPQRETWNDVLVYFNEKGELEGIEFYGSRYGCFISSKATNSPSWYQSMRRVTESPLYISIRLTTHD